MYIYIHIGVCVHRGDKEIHEYPLSLCHISIWCVHVFAHWRACARACVQICVHTHTHTHTHTHIPFASIIRRRHLACYLHGTPLALYLYICISIYLHIYISHTERLSLTGDVSREHTRSPGLQKESRRMLTVTGGVSHV